MRKGKGYWEWITESDDEDKEVKNMEEDKLTKQEEMLQYVVLRHSTTCANEVRQAAARSRKKDLPTPDHALINYEPFRKAFYNPPVEALEMDEE